ncbi:MFS transporter [Deinococcus pimensis]|uniref:MFS transporter n=1 Tax=Deinococcus pimensis TaxID=309888 RepID=UPI000484B9EF|nr:MFS transporter [Deinococcus pimensis]
MTAPSTDGVPGGFRTFLVLWSTQSLSVLGSALAGFAFNIYLTQTLYPLPSQKAQLALALSATALAFGLTAILGAPLAGAWADRHDRRRIMIACDALSGLVALVVALLVLYARPPLALLVGLMAVSGLLATFHGSAFDTSYSSLVPRAQLPRANGMMQTMWSLSGLASPALAAAIISLPALARGQGALPWLAAFRDGVPLAMLVNAASFVFAALVLTRLKIPSPVRSLERRPRGALLHDVTLGWRYILARRPLLWLLLTFAVINFVTSPLGIYETLLVRFHFQPDWAARGYTFETALALITTVASVGGVLGGVLVSAWGGLRARRVLGVLVPMIVSAGAQFVFGASTLLFVGAAALAVVGMMVPVMNAHSQSIWQAQVPPELQGRVFSVRRLIAQFTSPVSVGLMGSLAGVLDPGLIVRVSSLVLIVFCAAQLLNTSLRRADEREWVESLARDREAARAA